MTDAEVLAMPARRQRIFTRYAEHINRERERAMERRR